MNILDLLHELNVTTAEAGEHHHAREGWVQTDCPWCSPNTGKFRMGFHLDGLTANCWACGNHRVWETVAALAGEPVGKLAGRLKTLETRPYLEREHLGKLHLPKQIGPLLKPHLRYLRERGFSPKQLTKLWKVQGIDHRGGNLAWRLFIPIIHQGETVSWTTRSIACRLNEDTAIRYITAKVEESAIPRTKLLYGEDYVRWSVIVCEGPTDVWAIGPGAVATLGTGVSQEQIAKLIKYPQRTICFDSEPAAQARARKLVDQLCEYPGSTYNLILDGKDPASVSKSVILKIRSMMFGE